MYALLKGDNKMSKQIDIADVAEVKTIHILNNDFNMYGTIEEPLFLAQDIAAMIEYSLDKVDQMLANVDDDEKLTDTIYRAGQQREMWFVTENGLYELLMQSRKPLAKAFKTEIKTMLRKLRIGYLKQATMVSNDKYLNIENAHIFYKNFSGEESKYNRFGNRNFCVAIDDADFAQHLIEEGWNVKESKPRDDSDEISYYIQVAVRFDNVPPKIIMISRNGRTTLDEESVKALDFAEIKNVDLSINPSKWNVNEKSGIKAYLRKMFVTLEDDALEAKYAEEEYPCD